MTQDTNTPNTGKIQYGMGKKTLCSYFSGLMLSLLLTFAAFSLAYYKISFTKDQLILTLSGLAVLQFFTQIHYFLRLQFKNSGKINALPFIFALIIICILVMGSLWIMYHLNYNMAMH